MPPVGAARGQKCAIGVRRRVSALSGIHVQLGGEPLGHLDHLLQLGMSHDDHAVADQGGPPVPARCTDRQQVDDDDVLAVRTDDVARDLSGVAAVALRAADEAVRLMPEVTDAVNAPQIALLRAWVLIRSGTRAEEGYAELERWLGSYGWQPRWVAAEPLWRILRDDARTEQIFRDSFPKP